MRERVMDKMKDLERSELRSEKVRGIIGEKPPMFIRYGTIIISTVLLIIGVIIYVTIIK